jgi:hypothetical protein
LDSLGSLNSLDFSYSLPRFIALYIIVFEFRIPHEFRIHGIRTLLMSVVCRDRAASASFNTNVCCIVKFELPFEK